ncbi:MAG: ArsB/NhaD family transporter, partial [Dehalococcoidales bacterium]|nr:ArsB/NhaD family transporter [Dehalococcoidales bacterium]
CVSLDLTGFFRYLALLATRAAGNSGKKLFLYFFLLSSILTVFTSNDIVILTMTPIICYCAQYADCDPIPFLIAQFFAANIWSVALYIGNPTNIIVAQAYGLTFLEYSRWMALPTVVTGCACLALLWVIFRKRIPERVKVPQIDPRDALKDRGGAIFGVVCFLVCLVLLSLSSWLDIEIWLIPVLVAAVMLTRDVVTHGILIIRKRKTVGEHFSALTSASVIKMMPWKVVPFIIGSFIMVEDLSSSGWISIFAGAISRISSGLLSATLGIGFLSSLAANLVNNQPMTILFTRILENPAFVASAEAKKAGMFALIMGSNFGANFTFMGALAGIMWTKILTDKGIHIPLKEFLKYGLLIMPLLIVIGALVLVVEMTIWS